MWKEGAVASVVVAPDDLRSFLGHALLPVAAWSAPQLGALTRQLWGVRRGCDEAVPSPGSCSLEAPRHCRGSDVHVMLTYRYLWYC
jgi:hypothetical protein